MRGLLKDLRSLTGLAEDGNVSYIVVVRTENLLILGCVILSVCMEANRVNR
jgi:hypothetical protein